jgi:hypothetical protein
MSAHSPRSVAASASSPIDPDGHARTANGGEPSAGIHPDPTIDEDAVHGLVTAADFAAAFDTHRDAGTLSATYRRLAAEQAAPRRLATLLARGGRPARIDSYDNAAGPIAACARGGHARGGGGANHR